LLPWCKFGSEMIFGSISTVAAPCQLYLLHLLYSTTTHLVIDIRQTILNRPIHRYSAWADNIVFDTVGNIQVLRTAFMSGELIVISDGSYKDPYSTGGWILTTAATASEHYIQGTARSTGPPTVQDSHRAEAFGILGGVYTLFKYLSKWGLSAGSITFAAENTSALNYAFNLNEYPSIQSTYPDFDVFISIRRHMLQQVTYNLKHVKGHQDKRGAQLDHWASLNIRMDLQAKARRVLLETAEATTNWNAWLPGETWTASMTNEKLCKQPEDVIKDKISRQQMKLYWNKRQRIPAQHFDTIAWDAVGKAMKQIPITRRHWIVKHVSGLCGVNSVLKLWGQKDYDTCPSCSAIETANHVWICPASGPTAKWEETLLGLDRWLTKNKTDRTIKCSLLDSLRQWRTGDDLTLLPRSALEAHQDSIGWHGVIEGCLSTYWMDTQQQYFASIKKRRSSLRWITQLIVKLWDVAWDLWEYRNDVEHKNDRADLLLKCNHDIQEEIEKGFAGLGQFHVFNENEDLVTASLAYKRALLRNVQTARERALRRTPNSEVQQMQGVMRRFLGRS